LESGKNYVEAYNIFWISGTRVIWNDLMDKLIPVFTIGWLVVGCNRYTNQLLKIVIMIFKLLNRLQQIDQLIRQKRTGNADELAAKLNISRRQVYYWLEELKSYGLEIDYNRDIKSFVYQKPYEVTITFKVKEIES